MERRNVLRRTQAQGVLDRGVHGNMIPSFAALLLPVSDKRSFPIFKNRLSSCPSPGFKMTEFPEGF